MLFNTNDNNQLIHSGNYEEYFILYMDNELNEEQMKMVDEFLARHPELQAEFDLLLGTKLPSETFVFDKNSLLADSMKLNAVDENLLLLVDNELPAEQISSLQQKISNDKDLQLQHELLLKTKLDATEIIPYPNKKELYRRTGGLIIMRPWMRVAAAAVVIAVASVLYFNSEKSVSVDQPKVAINNVSNNNPASGQQNSVPEIKAPAQNNQLQNEQPQVAVTNSATYAGSSQDNKENDVTNLPSQMQGQIAIRDHKNTTTEGPDDGSVYKHLSRPSDAIQGQMASEPIASIDLQKQSINNSPVTTALQKRNTNTEPDPNNPEIEGPVTYAPSQKSGSLRGFLRKATRVIEKRTGIASTSDDDGEILIGALAVKVK